MENLDQFIISPYTQQDAIEDGLFVDISAHAHAVGWNKDAIITMTSAGLWNEVLDMENVDDSAVPRVLMIFLIDASRHLQRLAHENPEESLFTDESLVYNGIQYWVALEGPGLKINIFLPSEY